VLLRISSWIAIAFIAAHDSFMQLRQRASLKKPRAVATGWYCSTLWSAVASAARHRFGSIERAANPKRRRRFALPAHSIKLLVPGQLRSVTFYCAACLNMASVNPSRTKWIPRPVHGHWTNLTNSLRSPAGNNRSTKPHEQTLKFCYCVAMFRGISLHPAWIVFISALTSRTGE
jgi:hypothetical protein